MNYLSKFLFMLTLEITLMVGFPVLTIAKTRKQIFAEMKRKYSIIFQTADDKFIFPKEPSAKTYSPIKITATPDTTGSWQLQKIGPRAVILRFYACSLKDPKKIHSKKAFIVVVQDNGSVLLKKLHRGRKTPRKHIRLFAETFDEEKDTLLLYSETPSGKLYLTVNNSLLSTTKEKQKAIPVKFLSLVKNQ